MKIFFSCIVFIMGWLLIIVDDTNLLNHTILFCANLVMMFSKKEIASYFPRRFSPYVIIYAGMYYYFYFNVSIDFANDFTIIPFTILGIFDIKAVIKMGQANKLRVMKES